MPAAPGFLRSGYGPALAWTLVTVAALAAFLAISPGAAADIVNEGGAVEWLQVALFAGAALAAFVAARQPPAAPDVLLVLLFAAFIELELDLDRYVFGRPVLDKRFLTDALVPRPLRLLTALALLALAAAVVVFAWRRRAELIDAAGQMARQPSGHLLVAGLALMLGVQLFERQLGRALPLPRYFLEESLELLSGIYCLLGTAARARRDKGSRRVIAPAGRLV